MSMQSAFARVAGPVALMPSSTSYFSQPDQGLDPRLFNGSHLRAWVRNDILGMVRDYFARRFRHPERWTKVWLAGSGVSYQWSAARDPGDLDCLIGIDFDTFRYSNEDYARWSNTEIVSEINEGLYADLRQENWNGYELTFYVNQDGYDIRSINPYAAYSLDEDNWTVAPDPRNHVPHLRSWQQKVQSDTDLGTDLIRRYSQALTDVRAATNPAHRINAERKLTMLADQASMLYDDIHQGRHAAFSRTGAGYQDFGNFRWQSGKASGIIPALKQIKVWRDTSEDEDQVSTYGITLPDTDTLIRRAASSYARSRRA